MGREQDPGSQIPPDTKLNFLADTDILTIAELEAKSERIGRHAGMPFNLHDETPNLTLQRKAVRKNYPSETREERETIIIAAQQAHARATRQEYPTMPEAGLIETMPDISTWRFLPEILTLPTNAERIRELIATTQVLSENDIVEKIQELAQTVKIGHGRKYYAPFYTGELDTQLEVTQAITVLRERTLSGDEIEILPAEDRVVVEVVNDWVRGKRLPTGIAASCVEPKEGADAAPNNDHDSGNCDDIFNEANYEGEQGIILARKGKFVLLQTPDSHAWVAEKDIEVAQIPDDESRKYIPTPHDLLEDFIEMHREAGYKWGHEDCSSSLSESSRWVLGRQLGKYTADIGTRLAAVVGDDKVKIIDDAEKLDLNEGLYVIDLGNMVEKEVDGEIRRVFGDKSRHMWLCAVIKDGSGRNEYYAYSMAFQLVNRKGETVTPVGLHRADEDMLQGYVERKSALRAVPISLAA